jgi:predicted glycogen debranching enzyme
MEISFDRNITTNLDEAIRREWIETNGLGGWASSTLSGAHTRRYHGLLVAATKPPVGRMVMLSKLDETIEVEGRRYPLGANCYPGVIHPRGFEHLTSFVKDIFPRFVFDVEDIRLQKTIVAPQGENTTLVLYEVLEADEEFALELQPFMAPRDYHSLSKANDAIRRQGEFSDGVFRVQAYDGVPMLFIKVPGASFEPRSDWYYHFDYGVERSRGLDDQEDLFTHGVFTRRLRKGDRLGIIISTEPVDGRDAFVVARGEEERRTKLFERLPLRDKFTKTLVLAADQFIVKRGQGLNTLIAGYHWFSDWGRDTMIALPGITLVTGRHQEAKNILRAFAGSVSQGMLPNRFPDAGEEPEYNTVDATLWFFVAIHKYLQYTGDERFVREEIMPILREIILWHDRGTRYNIHIDSDGLLSAGVPGVQLTWMDARIGNWVVTPRQGKAVEINALWYNALMIYGSLAQRFAMADAEILMARASRVRSRFLEVFWNQELGGLYDYVDGDFRDAAIRPNQVFALSLPFPLLHGDRAISLLGLVRDSLLTPVGLRSLSPDHPEYRPRYGGDPVMRDSAYHQGTVWSWLLGPYVSALANVYGRGARKEISEVLAGVIPHVGEAGIGSISEVFDADPPHMPGGCMSQAWSVGEILRAYLEDLHGFVPIDEVSGSDKLKRVRQEIG